MTQIHLLNDDYVWEVRGLGHTDTQICAGVSALIWAFAGMVVNAAPIYTRSEDMKLTDGDVYIQIQKPSKNQSNTIVAVRNIDAAFKMLKIGLLQIEKKYPQKLDILIEK